MGYTTYDLSVYTIRKLFKENFYKKYEKVINFLTIFLNLHKTVSKNGWITYFILSHKKKKIVLCI